MIVVSTRCKRDASSLPRREFVAGAAAALWMAPFATRDAHGAPPDRDCPRCAGLGRIPLADAKPFVWTLGSPLPKLETIVGDEFCPVCQSAADSNTLATEVKQRIDAAVEKHKQWEERTGWNLVCVVTRHATVHAQLTVGQTRQVGTAL